MKISQDLLLFCICIIFGIFLIDIMGIGGSEFHTSNVWDLVRIWAGVGLLIFCAAIIAGLGLAGAQVIGSGAGPLLPDAISWGIYGIAYTFITGFVANFFFKIDNIIPNLGTVIGGFFLVVIFVAFILDLHSSITTHGGRG